jgi:hypothetical protein
MFNDVFSEHLQGHHHPAVSLRSQIQLLTDQASPAVPNNPLAADIAELASHLLTNPPVDPRARFVGFRR